MPYGRYPGRVRDFRKWASGMVDKSDISNRATSASYRYSHRRRRGLRRKRKNATKD